MAPPRRRSFMDLPTEPETKEAPQFTCVAHGCPVVAGIRESENSCICRFHHEEPGSVWQEITRRLRQRAWMVRLVDWLYGRAGPAETPDWREKARKLIDGANESPALHPADGEGAWRYAERLDSEIGKRVRTGLERPKLIAPVRSGRAAEHLPSSF